MNYTFRKVALSTLACAFFAPSLGYTAHLENSLDQQSHEVHQRLDDAVPLQPSSESSSSLLGVTTVRLDVGSFITGLGGPGDGRSGSLDALYAFTTSEDHIMFTQFGLRRSNTLSSKYRTTSNLGIGYRRFFDDTFMLGANAFIDHDLSRGHNRFGIGAEYAQDFFTASINGYFGVSDWKISPSLDGFVEKPANGFDIRLQGQLPQHPKLGGKLVYEQYFGQQVGLFGEGMRQQSPHAWIVGLTYTPVSALTVGIDQRFGHSGTKDYKVTVQLNYKLGVALSKQLTDQSIVPLGKLANMRHALIERNNEILLKYKSTSSQDPQDDSPHQLSLSADPTGAVAADDSEFITLTATITKADGTSVGQGVAVTWNTTLGEIFDAGIQTDAQGKVTAKVRSVGGVFDNGTVTATSESGISASVGISFHPI